MNPPAIIQVEYDLKALAEIRELFTEYARALDYHICFDGFEKELAGLPGMYAAPHGRLFLARVGSRPAGCVAIKKSTETICELKRLYVRPEFRGNHLGRQLAAVALAEARVMGYRKVELDTLPELKAAQSIYRAAGFQEKTSSTAGRLEMEMDLSSP